MTWNRLAALCGIGMTLFAGAAEVSAQTYPIAPDQIHRRLSGRRADRCAGASRWPVRVGAHRPAGGDRKQARCGLQHRDRSRNQRAGRRVHRSRLRDGQHAIQPDAVQRTLPFDFLRCDIVTAVAGLARVPNTLSVHPSVPAKTVAEFIQLREGQRRQGQHGIVRQWHDRSSVGRTCSSP